MELSYSYPKAPFCFTDEEFEEADVVFSELDDCSISSKKRKKDERNANEEGDKASFGGSLPIKIPPFDFLRIRTRNQEYLSEEEFDGDDMTPPHVIVGRRIARKMAFSVCTGNGRTLKGRDLSQVRNTILRLTGFLES